MGANPAGRPAATFLRVGHASRAAWQRLGRNAFLFGLNALAGPLIVIPVTWWATGFDTGLRPVWWNPVFDVLVLDLWIYWWHRANHEIQFFWRFHQVHHLDELLDTTSAFRFHFGEVVLSAAVRSLVVLLFDIPMTSVIVFEALVLASAIFQHSDAALPPAVERALAKVLITPGIHWVHHHAVREDTDSNYGTLFSFWDRIFGSKSRTERFAGMPLGVERMRERSLLRLLAAPFVRQPRANPAPRSARQ
ncbi:MAG: sterol desaturase family protein [Geminicoccaceae bacterium]